MKDLLKRFFVDEKEAEKRGYDAGYNGADERNCDFRIFSTPENTKAWERGNKNGQHERKLLQTKSKP